MHSEFEDVAEEPKDYTRWLWAGFAILVCIMVAALYISSAHNWSAPIESIVRAKHILIKFEDADPADRDRAFKQITELRERVVKGEDFGKLAAEYSNDPTSGPRGGDLGYAKRGTYSDEFEAYVWTAPLDQLSDVLKSGFGFHIIIVTDRRLSKVDQFEAAERMKKEKAK